MELRAGYRIFPEDVDFLKYHADVRALGMGLQIMPPPITERPSGLGSEQWESWTLMGGPIKDLLVGDLFTDGSCFKHGPPTWTQTGWAVVKVSREGTLLGWMRGTVGSHLPQTSPASETVAVLAGATEADHSITLHSDYQGLEKLEEAPSDAISHRKAIYAGPKLLARARAPAGFKVKKVRGHVSLEDCASEQERSEAMGNHHADTVAKGAVAATPSPTDRQIRDWHLQIYFLN